MREPVIEVVEGDALDVQSDVLILKYAQANYGVDRAASLRLIDAGEESNRIAPRRGASVLVSGRNVTASRQVLFVGVLPLFNFGYEECRAFARRSLAFLATAAPTIQHVTATLHGVGYGLDETEAFESEVAGFLDAIRSGDVPESLERISIVELDVDRCERLQNVLTQILPAAQVEAVERSFSPSAQVIDLEEAREERLRAVGYASDSKPHIFVAMPFKKPMRDVYEFGIRRPVKRADFLCERADTADFDGGVLRWVKDRIKTAELLIADLSDQNANVYLEVGYAWGCGIPTLLVACEGEKLGFNVQGQRCHFYESIEDLEKILDEHLKSLKARSEARTS